MINVYSFTFKYDQIPPELRLQFFSSIRKQWNWLLGFLFLHNLHPGTQKTAAELPILIVMSEVNGYYVNMIFSPTYLQQVTPGAVHIQTSLWLKQMTTRPNLKGEERNPSSDVPKSRQWETAKTAIYQQPWKSIQSGHLILELTISKLLSSKCFFSFFKSS